MSAISPKAALTAFPSSPLEHLKGGKASNPESEKARLRKATREFESFFNYYMLKTMRQTILQDDQTDQSLLSTGNSKDIFTDIFDTELARMMSLGRNNSIADMLYKSMEKLIDAGSAQNEAGEIRPLREASRPFELPQREFRPVYRRPSGVTLRSREAEPIALRSSGRAGNAGDVMQRYRHHIHKAAQSASLDPVLIASVITVESNGDPKAESPAGAKGLMQLADSTAADYGVNKVFDAGENISAGSRYLRDLIDRFGDLRLALAAYNAGPGNVVKYRGVPPFEETRSYVDKVLETFQDIHGRAGAHEPKVPNANVDKLATP